MFAMLIRRNRRQPTTTWHKKLNFLILLMFRKSGTAWEIRRQSFLSQEEIVSLNPSMSKSNILHVYIKIILSGSNL